MAHVGGRIRTLRSEREMTLDDLAKEAGLSKGLLSKLENTPDSNPSLDTLYKIAEAFDLTISDLIDTGEVQVNRYVPEKAPPWFQSIAEALKKENKKPDEDILQALYVLQSRKGGPQKDTAAWLYMYKSLELTFGKSAR